MSTRNEIKKALRENTREAVELITKAVKASNDKVFTGEELARITGDRLSTASVVKFLDRNHNNKVYWKSNAIYIKDFASLTPESNLREITVPEYRCHTEKVTKTYVNVEDANDVLTVNKEVTKYCFD